MHPGFIIAGLALLTKKKPARVAGTRIMRFRDLGSSPQRGSAVAMFGAVETDPKRLNTAKEVEAHSIAVVAYKQALAEGLSVAIASAFALKAYLEHGGSDSSKFKILQKRMNSGLPEGYKLVVDGIVGKRTRRAMHSLIDSVVDEGGEEDEFSSNFNRFPGDKEDQEELLRSRGF